MDSVPPYPEPSLRVLVSGECAMDPYPMVVILGCCQSPSSSRQAVEIHYCLDGGVLDTFLHKPWRQRKPSYHKHQGSNTYHSIRETWSSFDLPFLADVLLPRDYCTVRQQDHYYAECWSLWTVISQGAISIFAVLYVTSYGPWSFHRMINVLAPFYGYVENSF
jgi:hypothetical protein